MGPVAVSVTIVLSYLETCKQNEKKIKKKLYNNKNYYSENNISRILEHIGRPFKSARKNPFRSRCQLWFKDYKRTMQHHWYDKVTNSSVSSNG